MAVINAGCKPFLVQIKSNFVYNYENRDYFRRYTNMVKLLLRSVRKEVIQYKINCVTTSIKSHNYAVP